MFLGHLVMSLVLIDLLQLCLCQTDSVTCGSVVKLLNAKFTARLHSHDVKYGSGSGQQSVTAITDMDDHNSHWTLLGPLGEDCKRGEPVDCGSDVRLQHANTGCMLHSHHFPSPLSRNQEVSCFGSEGKGDTGDHWEVICDGDHWIRGREVRLKHKDTGTYLALSGHQYGRPIHGQKEVCALTSMGGGSEWKTAEGIYMMPSAEL